MTEHELSRLRADMVARMGGSRRAANPEIDEAFRTVPRHRYLPRILGVRGHPSGKMDAAVERMTPRRAQEIYSDTALPLRPGEAVARSTSSAPGVMRLMIQQLAAQPGDRVLEIGCGSGYNAAVLSQLVGPAGSVSSIEILAEVADDAAACLEDQGVANVRVVQGDGTQGLPDSAPFDCVIVTASPADIHPAWFDQLRDGGRIVTVLDTAMGQRLCSFERRSDHLVGRFGTWVVFVPVLGEHASYPLIHQAQQTIEQQWKRLRGKGRRQLDLSMAAPAWDGRGPAFRTFLETRYGRRATAAQRGRRYPGEVLFLSETGRGIARMSSSSSPGSTIIETCGEECIDGEIARHADDYAQMGRPDEGAMVVGARLATPGAGRAEWGIGAREFFEYWVEAEEGTT